MKNTAKDKMTKPGKMNIITSRGGKVDFYSDGIELSNLLVPGQVYTTDVNYEWNRIDLYCDSPLVLPEKIYDFDKDFRAIVLKSFRQSSNKTTGILLKGYKGQGKSVIAKQLAIEAELPIIVMTSKVPKTIDIPSFLNQIQQDVVLFIDEFEKLFDKIDHNDNKFQTQEAFLTVLDGVMSSPHKRLVILTTNDEVNDKFVNRPSRIRYYKDYNFMKKELFHAILNDKLNNKKFKKDLEENLDVASTTIDILTSIIDEINIQNKPYSSFKEFFNNRDREITYNKYKRMKDGSWTYIDEYKTKREIGLEDSDYFRNVFGYHCSIIKVEEGVIYFEDYDWIDDPAGGKDEDGDPKQLRIKEIFRAKKSEILSGGGKFSNIAF